ncbi:hypothetical protein GPECTOR_4g574 [Gonium pectorale]|uniref:Cyclin-like domain-containing protein n=1 Tax=Gonium pectorale TaxID=33097 RepID=A0A150GXG2_GONPE|nr:hypothetical protein GPECTOR_4g574 [Gonium pectorale]|eukprot:KXZ54509.1 hypothetical protein GPECTOR_4g574 [Gonium pectorale]
MDVEPCITCSGVDFIEFKSEGDLVCRDKDTSDPNRVGGPTSHLLEGLTTTIGRERNDGGLSYTLNRIHARTNNPDRLLVAAFKEVGRMCELLKVNSQIKDRACEVYKEVVEAKSLKGRSVKALAAACLFWACREGKQARTFKEIGAVLGNDVSKKEIGRCFKDLQQLKKDELHKLGASADALASLNNQTVQHPKDFVLSYCNQLRVEFKLKKVAEEIALNAKPHDRRVPWDGRTPTSIASAIVFIAMTMWEIRKESEAARAPGAAAPVQSYASVKAIKNMSDQIMQSVALISSVAEATIRAAYKDLFPHIPQLLPAGFATTEDVARLPNPDSRHVNYPVPNLPPPSAMAGGALPPPVASSGVYGA